MITYLIQVIAKIYKNYKINRYDDFSIANYFREQGARIGEHNRLEVRSLGPEPYLISIGNHCTVAPNVSFVTHDGGVWLFTEEFPDLQKFGAIKILDNCFIGMNSIIMPNTTIGPNSIVGAGSVVTKDVQANTIVAGNPARYVSSIETYRNKILAIWEKQRPSSYFLGIEDGKSYSPQCIQKMKFRDISILKRHLIQVFNKLDD
jgi:acetyltransferase-like isoleucine patch superfamily enzyme